jgi:hypothetical protein
MSVARPTWSAKNAFSPRALNVDRLSAKYLPDGILQSTHACEKKITERGSSHYVNVQGKDEENHADA